MGQASTRGSLVNLYLQAQELAGIAKHTPDEVDPSRVRAVCNQIVDLLAVLGECQSLGAYRGDDGYTLTLTTSVDSMADVADFAAALWA